MERTGKLSDVSTDDWNEQTRPAWRHSIWVGVWDPWPVIRRPHLWWTSAATSTASTARKVSMAGTPASGTRAEESHRSKAAQPAHHQGGAPTQPPQVIVATGTGSSGCGNFYHR